MAENPVMQECQQPSDQKRVSKDPGKTLERSFLESELLPDVSRRRTD